VIASTATFLGAVALGFIGYVVVAVGLAKGRLGFWASFVVSVLWWALVLGSALSVK